MTGNMFPNSTPFCSVTQRSIRDPGSLETHCHYLPAISITLETVEKITFPFFLASSFSRLISDLVQLLKLTKAHVCGHFNSFVNSPNLQVATFPTYANQNVRICNGIFTSIYIYMFFRKHQVSKYFLGNMEISVLCMYFIIIITLMKLML